MSYPAGKIHGELQDGEQEWKSPTDSNNKLCSSGGSEDTDVFQRMHDGNIAFRNYGDQPDGGDVHEEKGENPNNFFLARIQNHVADRVGRKYTSNTQISRRQGKNEPVGCCL